MTLFSHRIDSIIFLCGCIQLLFFVFNFSSGCILSRLVGGILLSGPFIPRASIASVIVVGKEEYALYELIGGQVRRISHIRFK